MAEYQAYLDCKNLRCQRAILLPYSKPAQKLQRQEEWPRADWQRNFLCLSCRHVCAYTAQDVQWAEPPSPGRIGQDTVVGCERFVCEQQNCGTLVEVLAVVNSDVPIYQSMSGRWTFDEVRCPEGHRVTQDPDRLRQCPGDTVWT